MPPVSSVSLAEVKRFAFAWPLAFCSTPRVTPKEHLIGCLRALCADHGGPDGVAEAVGVSAENLKQILAGTKLPSKQPRGVGPTLQRKIEAVFPGWAQLRPAALAAATTSPAQTAAVSADVAYVAEAAAKLSPSRMRRLIAAVDWLAGQHGDEVTITFSIAPRDDEPTPARDRTT